MDRFRNNPRGGGARGAGARGAGRAPLGSRHAPPHSSSLLGMGPSHSQSKFSSMRGGRGHGNTNMRSRNDFSNKNNARSFMDTPSSSNAGRRSFPEGGMGRPKQNNYNWSDDFSRGDGHSRSAQNDVSDIMDNFGLSNNDFQELLQLPENELSTANLAKVIDSLKKNKSYNNSSFDDSRRSGGGGYDSGRSRFSDGGSRGLLGPGPMHNDNYDDERDFKPNRGGYDMTPPSGRNNNWNDRPVSPHSRSRNNGGSAHRNPRGFDDMDDISFHDARGRHGLDHGDDFSSPSNRARFNDDGDYLRSSQQKPRSSRTAALRHEPRNARPRDLDDSHLHANDMRRPPPLMARKVPPSNSLLGDPPRRPAGPSRSMGLMDTIRGAADFDLPLLQGPASALLNSVSSDPALIEAQIRAMKAIQIEAMKLKSLEMKRERLQRMDRIERMEMLEFERMGERMPPRNNPSFDDQSDRGMTLTRKEKMELTKMRQQKGRVIFMRFKSSRITEMDLKMLAKRFGRVTRVFIIKAKAAHLMNQGFMELANHEDATAMLEHYMLHIPVIKGSRILMDRSNYREWNRKDVSKVSPSSSKTTKKPRVSPPGKGGHKGGKPSTSSSGDLAVSVSDDRRTVTHDKPASTAPNSSTADNKQAAASSSTLKDRLGPKPKRVRSKRPSFVAKQKQLKAAYNAAVLAAAAKEDLRSLISNDDDKTGGDVTSDPLDAIANELAMDEDFVLMDSVGADDEVDDAADEEMKDAEATVATDDDGLMADAMTDNIEVPEQQQTADDEEAVYDGDEMAAAEDEQEAVHDENETAQDDDEHAADGEAAEDGCNDANDGEVEAADEQQQQPEEVEEDNNEEEHNEQQEAEMESANVEDEQAETEENEQQQEGEEAEQAQEEEESG